MGWHSWLGPVSLSASLGTWPQAHRPKTEATREPENTVMVRAKHVILCLSLRNVPGSPQVQCCRAAQLRRRRRPCPHPLPPAPRPRSAAGGAVAVGMIPPRKQQQLLLLLGRQKRPELPQGARSLLHAHAPPERPMGSRPQHAAVARDPTAATSLSARLCSSGVPGIFQNEWLTVRLALCDLLPRAAPQLGCRRTRRPFPSVTGPTELECACSHSCGPSLWVLDPGATR